MFIGSYAGSFQNVTGASLVYCGPNPHRAG